MSGDLVVGALATSQCQCQSQGTVAGDQGEIMTSLARVADLETKLAEALKVLAETRELLVAKEQQCQQATVDLRALAGLRASIETANAPVVSVDRIGLISEWNRKASEVFGCDAQLARKRSLADFLHKEDRAGFMAFEAAVMSAPSTPGVRTMTCVDGHLEQQFRVRVRSANEAWHDVLVRASLRLGAEGAVEGALYIVQDLTAFSRERCEAELALQDLARLIQTVNAPIIGMDHKGVVNRWNRKAELLTGFNADEAIGKSFVQTFIAEEFGDSVQTMLSQGLLGQEVTNYEFSLFTKSGKRREILWSATARRDRLNQVVGVIGVGQDITELRSESKMLANYVRICGAAVWSLRGDANTGAVTDSKTKEIEHLISQQAQMDVSDPRMVLWRASFVSILKTMCQTFWMRRKEAQGQRAEKATASSVSAPGGSTAFTTDFGYEFCFEAPNGSVKWYKVQGHLIQEGLTDSHFEVTGSMQEVTSMLIDKVMGDRWQKWWNRMCHMVFDATLLVDTQEYRVLNAWGEEKVFGCKLQSHHPLLQLIKPEDTVSLKEAFNEVTFKGFERGRTLHLSRPGCDRYTPAQCFLLSADQENPNECMMGIRMQVSGGTDGDVPALWDVARPNPVLTLEDLARLKSGLRRSHRRPSRNVRSVHRATHRSRSSDPHASSHSLSSIPEDLHGEFEEDDLRSVSDRGSEAADSVAEDTESLQSSSNSSKSSSSISEVGVCNSSPARSATEDPPNARGHRGMLPQLWREFPAQGTGTDWPNPFGLGPKLQASSLEKGSLLLPASAAQPRSRPVLRSGPPRVKLRWSGQTFELNLDEFPCVASLRVHVETLTGVPPSRQTLILAGRRLPVDDESRDAGDPAWKELKASVRPGQALMMIGSAPPAKSPAMPPATSSAAAPSPAPGTGTGTSATGGQASDADPGGTAGAPAGPLVNEQPPG